MEAAEEFVVTEVPAGIYLYVPQFDVTVSLLDLAHYYKDELFKHYMNKGCGAYAYALAFLARDKDNMY